MDKFTLFVVIVLFVIAVCLLLKGKERELPLFYLERKSNKAREREKQIRLWRNGYDLDDVPKRDLKILDMSGIEVANYIISLYDFCPYHYEATQDRIQSEIRRYKEQYIEKEKTRPTIQQESTEHTIQYVKKNTLNVIELTTTLSKRG